VGVLYRRLYRDRERSVPVGAGVVSEGPETATLAGVFLAGL
jgi:hypothetical protein